MSRWIVSLSFVVLLLPLNATAAQRRRAVTPPVPLPSSASLIDRARAAGTITAEQAITYKVFADFGDSRLPSQFRGDDSQVTEADAPAAALAQWATLSAAARDLIGPYLVPPFYEGSWWDLRRQGAKSIRPLACRPWEVASACSILSTWKHVDGDHLRVWFEVADSDPEQIALDLSLETDVVVWPQLQRVMQRVPIVDHEIDGKKLLDVVLTTLDPGKLATTYSLKAGAFECGKEDSTFIVVNRSSPDYVITNRRRSFFAHELFHAVQHTYKTKLCLETDYRWLMESTATWFEDYLYPTVNREHDFAPFYLNETELSIDDPNSEDHIDRNYGVYLFFFYLTRIRKADPTLVVRSVWEATQSADALHALDSGLQAAGVPLEASWPDFAVYTWNEESPFDLYTQTDKMNLLPKSDTRSVSVTSGEVALELGLGGSAGLSLPYLAIRYFRFDFPDPNASSVMFYNGLQRALLLQPDAFVSGNVVTTAAVGDSSTIKGAHIDVLLKKNGQWTRDTWTGKPFKSYCRDLTDERIESLVIILSNSDISNTLKPQGRFGPLLTSTNIGCYAWDVSADLTLNDGSGRIEKMTVSGLRLTQRGDVPSDEFTPVSRLFSATAGTYSWSASGVSGACGYSGSLENQSLINPVNVLYTFPYAVVPPSAVIRPPGARGILPAIAQEWLPIRNIVKENCGTSSDDVVWQAGEFFLVTDPSDKFAQISSDGRTITVDAKKAGDGSVTGTWTFKAVRQ